MPHIIIESPAVLTNEIDWNSFFSKLHIKLADSGFGRLDDFKSRVINLEYWQVADRDKDALFLFATLQTMNPRPPEILRAMGSSILESLEKQAKEIANGRWLQVCVKVGGTPPEDYFKSHLNAPELRSGNFRMGE